MRMRININRHRRQVNISTNTITIVYNTITVIGVVVKDEPCPADMWRARTMQNDKDAQTTHTHTERLTTNSSSQHWRQPGHRQHNLRLLPHCVTWLNRVGGGATWMTTMQDGTPKKPARNCIGTGTGQLVFTQSTTCTGRAGVATGRPPLLKHNTHIVITMP